jgi:16S rRNA (guanine527-N7)-methyltransferase
VFRETLARRIASFVELSPEQLDQLEQHYVLLLRWNKVINLTRIDAVEDAVERHYAESLFLGSTLPAGILTIADIGSGGGFPGLPTAVLRPECTVTLIECHQRKAVFLKEASRSLKNVKILAARAEKVNQRFDWIVSRAVSWEQLSMFAPGLSSNIAVLGSEPPPGATIYSLPHGNVRVFHVKHVVA